MIKQAEFSSCGKYRYVLNRLWDVTKPHAMCIGLNPSRADAVNDDPTIRILCKSLNALGYGALRMVNLYSYISSQPADLLTYWKPIGETKLDLDMNEVWLKTIGYTVQDVIFCWGSFKEAKEQAGKVIEMFPDALCFGKNADGAPMHPMSLMYKGIKPADTKLYRFNEK